MEHETALLAVAAATLWGAAAFTLFRTRNPGRARVLAIAAGGMTIAAVNAIQMDALGNRMRDCVLSVADLQHELAAPPCRYPGVQRLRPAAPA